MVRVDETGCGDFEYLCSSSLAASFRAHRSFFDLSLSLLLELGRLKSVLISTPWKRSYDHDECRDLKLGESRRRGDSEESERT